MLAARTIPELLRAAAREAPDAEAFRYRSERLTYRDWDVLVDRVAAALVARGIKRGDVVALLLPSTPFYLVAYLAAARIGAITTGINTRYRRTEIDHILRRSGAAILLAVESWHDADFRAAVEPLRAELTELREVAWISGDALRESTAGVVGRVCSTPHPDPLPQGEGTQSQSAVVNPDDPVTIVFTSGTTGVPKGAWYTHRNLLALAEIDTRRYASGTPPFQKHLAAGISFAHIGTMARIALQIGHLGASLIHDAFDPAAVLEVIERERLTHLGGFPTQVIMLLDHPDRPRRDLSSLKSVLLGGAPSSPALIRRVQDTFGAQVSVRYSSTEVGIATASLPSDPPEILSTTVGKPTPGVELRIVDDNNQPVSADTPGEVVVRSPATMRGYWREPEQTAEKIDRDGWVHTGDIGFLDRAGYLHLRGRQSEMFIRGGYNVYPAEIEDRLAKHPKIARAAVIGVPDPVFGEVGWAFVVPRDAATPPTLAELREFVGTELASFKRPDGLTLLPELPLTPMFKIDKRALQALKSESSNDAKQ
ncbi:MAG TPA: class I adenylate-forming enzyme family protein [Candidatus Kryptonia bacterium]|nr:class I adenylate-forming enzyme family protein [Candidatus Kryptonia bacterium]